MILNPLNAKLNPICHFLALLGTHPILHVSGVRVNLSQINTVDILAPNFCKLHYYSPIYAFKATRSLHASQSKHVCFLTLFV